MAQHIRSEDYKDFMRSFIAEMLDLALRSGDERLALFLQLAAEELEASGADDDADELSGSAVH